MKILALAVLVVLVAASDGAAAPGLETRSLTYADPAVQSGSMMLGSIASARDAADGETSLYLDLTAGHVAAIQYESRYIAVPTGNVRKGDPEKITFDGDDVRLRIQSFQPYFKVNLIGAEAGNAFTANIDSGGFTSVPAAKLGAGGLRTAGVSNPAEDEFSTVERAGPLLLQNGWPAQSSFRVEGDLVLELWNVTLVSDDGRVLESGEWRTPIDPALPKETMVVAQEARRAFLRLTLTGAELDIATAGGGPRVEWAGPQVSSQHEGPITLVGASGKLKGPDGDLVLDDERVVVPASTLALLPVQDGIDVQIVPPADAAAPQQPALNTIVSSPVTLSVGIAALVILATAAGAAVVLVVRRRLRTPVLKEVEAAIAKAQYPRAAKLARRILRHEPDQEDALIGRAIALSRDGQPARVVREVEVHLKRREPSDGVLHYVLGLAYLDLGRNKEAESVLREAVRRTPRLQSDIQTRVPDLLIQSPATQNEMTKEAHGYA